MTWANTGSRARTGLRRTMHHGTQRDYPYQESRKMMWVRFPASTRREDSYRDTTGALRVGQPECVDITSLHARVWGQDSTASTAHTPVCIQCAIVRPLLPRAIACMLSLELSCWDLIKVELVPISHAVPLNIHSVIGRAIAGRLSCTTNLQKQHHTVASCDCLGQPRRCSDTSYRTRIETWPVHTPDTGRWAASPRQG